MDQPAGAVAAVPPAPAGWSITAHELTSGGRRRAFLVARPTVAPRGPRPILMVLQGRMLTPASIERITGFLARVGPAVVVYPAGYDQSWNAGYCCGGAHRAAVNDVAFLKSVVRTVVATQPGTSAHDVYLVGYSNGGRMAYRMACADPRAFAGVAAVEAVAVAPCSGRRTVPLIEVASTGDPLVTIRAGAPPRHIAGHTEETVAALVAHWRALEGCRSDTADTVSGDLSTTEWASCRGGSRIELAVYAGGSHAWPRGGPGTPSAEDLIWAFFRSVSPPAAADGRADHSPRS
jgi:polyhydroxybutyrate depolymerase